MLVRRNVHGNDLFFVFLGTKFAIPLTALLQNCILFVMFYLSNEIINDNIILLIILIWANCREA
jgi:membrane-bound acyltransferase YfiQ involved in biofilm formation